MVSYIENNLFGKSNHNKLDINVKVIECSLCRIETCKIKNMIYFFFVLDGHCPLFLEVDADEKEKMFTVISSLEHFII